MKIYVDACCWDRRHDNLTNDDIKAEAVAIMSIIDMCQVAGHGIVGSAAVLAELQGIPETDLRKDFERISANKKLSAVRVINPLKITMGGLI